MLFDKRRNVLYAIFITGADDPSSHVAKRFAPRENAAFATRPAAREKRRATAKRVTTVAEAWRAYIQESPEGREVEVVPVGLLRAEPKPAARHLFFHALWSDTSILQLCPPLSALLGSDGRAEEGEPEAKRPRVDSLPPHRMWAAGGGAEQEMKVRF